MDGFQGALNGKDGNRGQTGSEVDAWMGFRVHCMVKDGIKDGKRGQTGSEVDVWMGFRVH